MWKQGTGVDSPAIYIQEGGQLNTKRIKAYNRDGREIFSSIKIPLASLQPLSSPDVIANWFNKPKTLRSTQNSTSQVKSLLEIVLNFVAVNIVYVESLDGIPDFIGEQIFLAVDENKTLQDDYTQSELIVKLFVNAYGNLLLSSLDLSDKFSIINEYYNLLKPMIPYLTELDLSFCKVGDDHQIIESIGQIESLKKLYLEDSEISDVSLRKMFLPVSMFNKGPSQLTLLKLAYNRKVTDKSIHHLKSLKKLKAVDITGTSITENGITVLSQSCQMAKTDEADFDIITTSGWAKNIVKKWWESNIFHRPAGNTSPLTKRFYGSHHSYSPTFKKRRYSDLARTILIRTETKPSTTKTCLTTVKKPKHNSELDFDMFSYVNCSSQPNRACLWES